MYQCSWTVWEQNHKSVSHVSLKLVTSRSFSFLFFFQRMQKMLNKHNYLCIENTGNINCFKMRSINKFIVKENHKILLILLLFFTFFFALLTPTIFNDITICFRFPQLVPGFSILIAHIIKTSFFLHLEAYFLICCNIFQGLKVTKKIFNKSKMTKFVFLFPMSSCYRIYSAPRSFKPMFFFWPWKQNLSSNALGINFKTGVSLGN